MVPLYQRINEKPVSWSAAIVLFLAAAGAVALGAVALAYGLGALSVGGFDARFRASAADRGLSAPVLTKHNITVCVGYCGEGYPETNLTITHILDHGTNTVFIPQFEFPSSNHTAFALLSTPIPIADVPGSISESSFATVPCTAGGEWTGLLRAHLIGINESYAALVIMRSDIQPEPAAFEMTFGYSFWASFLMYRSVEPVVDLGPP